MHSDPHKPLKPKPKKQPLLKRAGLNVGHIAYSAVAITLLVAASYTALSEGNLRSVSTAANVDETALANISLIEEQPAQAQNDAQLELQSGQSGADIRRTQMADGHSVTVYSAGNRNSSDAVIMSGQTFGQDSFNATRPNEELIEQGAHGPLPIIGASGLRPMEQYARPWSGSRGTRIAIVVGGIGLSQTGSQRAIAELPAEVTLGFAATGNSLQRWMQEARRSGHEILLQMPMEPFGQMPSGMGEASLQAKLGEAENLVKLHRAMSKITNYTGVMNHLGGRFLSNAEAVEPVVREISGRGLLVLDDGTSAQSKLPDVSKALGAPYATGDLLLDSEVNEAAILRRLDDLERIARRNGSAIGVSSAFDETVSAVAKWVSEAQSRGIEVVGVASLISDRQ